MTTLKVIFTIALLISCLSFPLAKADVLDADKTSELNVQLVQEIKSVLEIPYLKYSGKDLNGDAEILVQVNKNGKITFSRITGSNENLVSNIESKVKTLNLWTSPDYSSKVFAYKIRYRE